MKPEILIQFKNLFESERELLLAAHAKISGELVISRDEMADETDLTSVTLEQNVRIRLRNREAHYIKKLNEAIARIEAGSFGVCESCEEPIEHKRLEARPTTSFCLSCKEEEERSEDIYGRGRKVS